ncbi:MAG TPA: phosphoglycerate dehydrogenase [Pyrinomonadaceae bacterium]|nr:phosphoglycerate dehydrogenase [Pyrinomonadaceae bacterium]
MNSSQTSYPRNKIKVLLLENVSDTAIRQLESSGYTNITKLDKALNEEDLAEAIKDIHILGIRSKTRITKRVLERAEKLLTIGAFCIGVNQIDLKAATEKGIAVFNAPYSNTRSVAELIIGLSVVLIRKIAEKNMAAHQGIWLKDAAGSHELRGKTLGIIGYGNIGSQVSILAEALGMHVIYFDIAQKLPHGNAKQVRELKELLAKSHIVTLHVPSDPSTRNLINEQTLKMMRKGSYLLNYSRGDVVDLAALKNAIRKGRLAGAALDVFPEEPEKYGDSFKCELQGLPQVILTPHIGGSTVEAQDNIGNDVAIKLIKYLELGTTEGSQTVPAVSLPPQAGTHRILHIHKNVPGVLSDINTRLSRNGINILGQYLKTNETIGYVILDIDKKMSKEAFELLRQVKATIRARMVY